MMWRPWSTTDGSMRPATRCSLGGLDAQRPVTEALPDAAAEPALYRRDPRAEAGGAGGTAQGGGHRGQGPAGAAAVVQAQGMAGVAAVSLVVGAAGKALVHHVQHYHRIHEELTA